jgi:hypothetical protein
VILHNEKPRRSGAKFGVDRHAPGVEGHVVLPNRRRIEKPAIAHGARPNSKAPLPAWPTPSTCASTPRIPPSPLPGAQVLGPAGKVQRPEPTQLLGPAADFIDAADVPPAAKDQIVGVVFVVPGGSKPAGAHREGHRLLPRLKRHNYLLASPQVFHLDHTVGTLDFKNRAVCNAMS